MRQECLSDRFGALQKCSLLLLLLLFLLLFLNYVSCHGQVVKSIEFKFWWLSHRSVGSNPGSDTCVLEQDSLLCLLLYTYGHKWVPAMVQVDIVYEKAFGAPRQLGAVYSPGS